MSPHFAQMGILCNQSFEGTLEHGNMLRWVIITSVHCWLLILLVATFNRYKPKYNMSTFVVLLEFSLGAY